MNLEVSTNAKVSMSNCRGEFLKKCRFLGNTIDKNGQKVAYCEVVDLQDTVKRLQSGEEDPREPVLWDDPYPRGGPLVDYYSMHESLISDRTIDSLDDVNPDKIPCPKGFSTAFAEQTLMRVREELETISQEIHNE